MSIIIRPYDECYFSLGFEGNFNSRMLGTVRAVHGRVYNNKDKLWLIPNAAVQELLQNIYNLGIFNKVSPSTQNQALSALLFYFRYVEKREYADFNSVVHAKKKPRIPVVLSRNTVMI